MINNSIKKLFKIFLLFMLICVAPTQVIGLLIGTHGDEASIILYKENGYTFYSDSNFTTEISGSYNINTPNTIYVKAEDNYIIESVTIENADGSSGSTASATNQGTYWSLSFPTSVTKNQRIIVTSYVNAPGGTIDLTNTEEEIAAMFDSTAMNTAITDNVVVEKDNNVFNVIIKNNILLNGMYSLNSDVTLNLISAGNNTIKRNFGFNDQTTYMFYLPMANSNLILGSGTISNDTITYHFNDGTNETYDVGGTIPTSDNIKYVLYTTTNTEISSNMEGTLTIDGGAILNEYTGITYSFDDSSNYTGNIIKVESGGNVQLWENVILQNNKILGRDTEGGSAINISNGNLFMYGGIIQKCVCAQTHFNPEYRLYSSDGDGGAFMLNSNNTKAYIYSGEITHCESDNSSAISLWNGSNLHFMNGNVHNNFSVGDSDYTAQAISVYNSSVLYMYGGLVSDNQGINDLSEIRISSSGNNVLNLYDGTIESVGSNAVQNVVNIYSGQVEYFRGLTNDQPMQGTINYYGGESYVVTMPNAINADGSQLVHLYELRTDVTPNVVYKTTNTSGVGTNTNPNTTLSTLLKNGVYTITVTSTSMQKVYSVVVNNSDSIATSVSRTMLAPELLSSTNSSVTLKTAGTNNSDVDGIIQYGYSTTNNYTTATWQNSPTFNNLTSNQTYYFFVRINATSTFSSMSVSPSLEVFLETPTISIDENPKIVHTGDVYILEALITPSDFPIENIKWEIIGANSFNSSISKNSNGTATLIIGLDETSHNISIRATILDDVGDTIDSDVIELEELIMNSFVEVGRKLNHFTSNKKNIQIARGEAYSIMYDMAYINNGSNIHSLIFSKPLPINTKITLITFDVNNPGDYYHYNVNSPTTTVLLSNFIKNGTSEYFVNPTSGNVISEKMLISVDFKYANISSLTPGDIITTMDIGLNGTTSVTTNLLERYSRSGSITMGTISTAENNSIIIPVTVSAIGNKNKVLSISLLDTNGEVLTFPIGTSVNMNSNAPNSIRGNIAIFNLGTGNINNQNYTVNIVGIKADAYKVRVDIGEVDTSAISHPLGGSLDSKTTSTLIVNDPPTYKLKVTTMEGQTRNVEKDTDIDLKLTYNVSQTGTLTIKSNNKTDNNYNGTKINQTFKISTSGTNFGNDVSNYQINTLNTNKNIYIRLRSPSESGTYRYYFYLGTTEIKYNIIVE